MATVATVVGGSSPRGAAVLLLSHVTRRLIRARVTVTPIDLRDPDAGGQHSRMKGADGVLVVSAAQELGPGGSVQHFLASLPPASLPGIPVLSVLIGRPEQAAQDGVTAVLRTLGAAPAGRIMVPASTMRVFPDGGVLIDPASSIPIAELTDGLVAALHGCGPVGPAAGGRVSPVAGAADLVVRQVRVGDAELQPLLDELVVEYGTRYGRISAEAELTEVPASDFLPPHGAFLLIDENGISVAGGALRRYDDRTAEVKRVWTSSRHRRRGLAARVMAELEQSARDLGYQRLHLTTGPRQPEARALYLAAGYHPRFDVTADPETIGPLAFGKELVPGAGFVDWVQPTWAQVQSRHAVGAGAPR